MLLHLVVEWQNPAGGLAVAAPDHPVTVGKLRLRLDVPADRGIVEGRGAVRIGGHQLVPDEAAEIAVTIVRRGGCYRLVTYGSHGPLSFDLRGRQAVIGAPACRADCCSAVSTILSKPPQTMRGPEKGFSPCGLRLSSCMIFSHAWSRVALSGHSMKEKAMVSPSSAFTAR